MARQSTSTLLRVNAKVESFNTIMLPNSTDTVTEGLLVDATGALADASTPVAFLAWNDDTRSDVTNSIKDPASGDSITIQTGGMAGIIGNGVMVGLPTANVNGNGASSVAGDWITSDANGVVTTLTEPALDGTPAAIDTWVFGRVIKVEGGIVFFMFSSAAIAYDIV